ncbi:MAG: DUF4383 domain-containing protein [Dehalococcoidia bacterium]|nr:DUF4383 domain-containing protein [Dehalococcoidia bacterium]MCB9483786.1 DUF4383 domain-containing protein [Dehalococcoidia bacterium]
MNTLRTPTQIFILIAGLFHIALGVSGLIGPWVDGAGAGGQGELFGFFAVNGWLDVLNLVGGGILVIASMTIPAAVWASRVYAVAFAALAIWGIAEIGLTGSEDTVLGNWLYVNVVANWAYAALAVLYAVFGFIPQMWHRDVVTGENRGRIGGHAYR